MNIIAYIEHWDGKFKKLSWELMTYAGSLARQTGGKVFALVFGEVQAGEIEKLGSYGPASILHLRDDRVKMLDNAVFAALIAEYSRQNEGQFVLFSANFTGKALAPRVTARLNAGLISGVNGLPGPDQAFPKGVFSGKAAVNVKPASPLTVLTLSPNILQPEASSPNHQLINVEWPANIPVPAFELISEQRSTGDKILLTDADIVVSAGRGLKGPENWGPVEELAQLLGAATACSRPVADEGWRPHHEHVGQTGLMVAPNLYFAFGISGAIQHLAGISSSKVIVAVNKDPEAPIFEAARYGVLGDVQQVLPQLIAEFKKFRQNN